MTLFNTDMKLTVVLFLSACFFLFTSMAHAQPGVVQGDTTYKKVSFEKTFSVAAGHKLECVPNHVGKEEEAWHSGTNPPLPRIGTVAMRCSRRADTL